MTWAEPLTALSRDTAAGYDVAVLDGGQKPVAGVRIDVFGEPGKSNAVCRTLKIIDPDGAPRQRARALALLMREALQHAAQLGVRYAQGAVTPAMLELAKKITGYQPDAEPAQGLTMFAGDLMQWFDHARAVTDDDGNVR